MIFVLLAVLAADEPVSAADVTSRPGIGDASLAVPKGAVLFSPGLTVQGPVGSVGPATGDTVPDALLRIGVVDGVEARGDVQLDAAGKSVALLPSFGLAFQVLHESDAAPAMLAIATVFLPTSAAPGALGVEGRLSAGKGFGDFGTGANLAVAADATGATMSATLGGSFTAPPGLTPFVEVFGDAPIVPLVGAPNIGVDGGVGVAVNRNVAVDVSAGATFVGEQSLFVSVGTSLFWP